MTNPSKGYFPQGSLPKTSMDHPCTPCVPYALPISFLSYDNFSDIWLTVQIINLTNRHLALALPVCVAPENICMYHVHCATGSTLPLAMSTQSVDRAADSTEVCGLLCLLSVGGIIGLIALVLWGAE